MMKGFIIGIWCFVAFGLFVQFILDQDDKNSYDKNVSYLFEYESERDVNNYTSIIASGTHDPEIFHKRGSLFYRRREYQRAIDDFTSGIKLKPDDAFKFHYLRGCASSFIGNYSMAISDFEQCIKLHPYDEDTRNLLANTKKINNMRLGLYWGVVCLTIIASILSLLSIYKTYLFIGGFVCPYCYSTHKLKDCGLKCSCNSSGMFTAKCPSNIYKEYNDWIPRYKNRHCIKCNKAAVDIYCPAFVDRAIPAEYIKMKSLRIALLGAKSVGKSNYIGVLIEEVRNRMSMAFNCSLSLAFTKESQDAYDQYYYRPLYKDGYTVQATDAGVQVPPLIFPLAFMDKSYKIAQTTALTFYDTAGENLNDTNSMHLFNGYIANAQGIMLLLDPLQVPEIRDQLTAKGFTDLPQQNTETARVLDAVIKVITSVNSIEGQIGIPLALVFTKIDVLEQYNILPANSCFRKESEYMSKGMFVQSDFENAHLQMEALIDNWLEGALMSYIKLFKHYAFFGVSALGASPVGNMLGGKVKPRRVLDPLLWLLAREKYIGVVR